MNVYTLLTVVTSGLCLLVGNFVYYRNKNSALHRIFAICYYLAGAYCLILAGLYLSNSQGEAWQWLRLSALAHLVPALSFHGILILTAGDNGRVKLRTLALVYVPYFFLFFQDLFFTELTYALPERAHGGWVTIIKTSSGFHLLDMSIYAIMLSAEFYALVRLLFRTSNKFKRKLALFLVVNMLVPIVCTAIMLLIFPFFLIPSFVQNHYWSPLRWLSLPSGYTVLMFLILAQKFFHATLSPICRHFTSW